MKKNFLIIFLMIFLSASVFMAKSCFASFEEAYQADADHLRLEHLLYWTGLIEEYYKKTGHYPFQDKRDLDKQIIEVRIATREQAQYFTKGNDKYVEPLDINSTGRFKEVTVKDFVAELEKGLGRAIDEKYDPQRVPTYDPIWYHYFTNDNGYLLYVTCISCGTTEVSTLLVTEIAHTPTVNIGSEAMAAKVTKALTRDKMMENPTFKSWMAREWIKEGFFRELEEKHKAETKLK